MITQVDRKIWRGPQPAPFDLVTEGFQATLDLETGAQWLGDGSPLGEAVVGNSMGIRVWSHPLGTFLPPTLDELHQAVNFLNNQQAKGIKTLVHCKKGVDRTGMVCAAYRILTQDWSLDAAGKEMSEAGFHIWYTYWVPQLVRLK